jgi:hypothetical protein
MVTATFAPVLRQSLDNPAYATVSSDDPHSGLPGRLTDFLEFVAERMESEVVVPLLEGDDLEKALLKRLDTYKQWAYSGANALVNQLSAAELQELVSESQKELRALVDEQAVGCLGEQAAQSLKYALDLMSIVREAMLDARDEWEPDEFEAVGRQIVAHDLCTMSVVHYILNGVGQLSNAQRLASWSFHYADFAYLESGLADSNHNMGTRLGR